MNHDNEKTALDGDDFNVFEDIGRCALVLAAMFAAAGWPVYQLAIRLFV